MRVALVTPVYGNEATLEALAARVAAALDGAGLPWSLQFVVDASPDGSLALATSLAEGDDRLTVTALPANVGQHRALLAGLAVDAPADAWVCLDADLQDPPEAVPLLVERLARGDVGAVFAGRRGAYEGPGRLITGRLHRAALSRLTGVPSDAGAFVALDRAARHALVALGPPSIVAGIGGAGILAASVPVVRAARTAGASAWTWRARAQQAGRTLAWAWRIRA
jgi:glycosyltransferase involved in cell wall biosynthesis